MNEDARYCSRCRAPIEDDDPYTKGQAGEPICELCAKMMAANEFMAGMADNKERPDEQV